MSPCGLVVCAITDITSAIKPLVPGLLVAPAPAVTAPGFLIFRGTPAEEAGEPELLHPGSSPESTDGRICTVYDIHNRKFNLQQ